jgi:hypothetical protein
VPSRSLPSPRVKLTCVLIAARPSLTDRKKVFLERIDGERGAGAGPRQLDVSSQRYHRHAPFTVP